MLTAYPVAGKAKSWEICEAFVRGCGGAVARGCTSLLPGPSFFYGVDDSNEHLWREARADLGREWFYCDNSYFDSARGTFFRVTKNRLQHPGTGQSTGERFASLGIEVKPWRSGGDHVVVCPQSEHFMHRIAGYQGDWLKDAVWTLKNTTPRAVRVRSWDRDKKRAASTLQADLDGAYALATWSSAAAVTALIEGVPVVVQGKDCAAKAMSGELDRIEALPKPDDRERWAGVLADNQWSLDEFARGDAWKALQ